ncbi:amidohydrolase family-domain-containing protein [Fusarium sp. MPI-SDFR-AT-0072]|nr:amidohydrolase family-domain-containing protein [Fusarium sp. MPI-SDFR-AT-0072]
MSSTILTNGRFVGDDDSHRECMIMQESKIAYIGSENDKTVQDAKSQGAEILDLGHRVVLPGFIDSHVHLLFFGLSQQKLDLGGCKSLIEIRQRITDFAAANPDLPKILCRGWLQSATDGVALASMIDDIDPRPIFIDSNDLHSAWCNTAALKELPIDEIKAKCPEHLTCDENGNPTGLLAEWAVTAFIWPFLIQSLSMDDKLEALERAVQAYSAEGYTGVIDMAMDAVAWEALQTLRDRKGINLHIAAHWFIPYEADEKVLDEKIQEAIDMHSKFHPSKSPEFCIVGVKLMCDGVVDGCTAALSYPYGESTDLIQPLWPGEAMNHVLSQITKAGMQCAIHAIGDVAVSQAISAIASTNNPTARHRIEHLEMATPEDARRLGSLGITASVQPVHSDPAILEGYEKLVKPSAWKHCFPYKECLDGHANVAIGTDAPTARHLPFPNLYNATTRKSALEPERETVTNGDSALTLEQAVRGATYGAAYSRFAEGWTGRLEKGLRADFMVLPGIVRVDGLLEMKVDETWFGGERVYKKTGCSTCKRRHRKCDETKPTCLECQKNNLTCEGYALRLQWDIGVASRGKLTGASLPVLGAGNERKRGRGFEIDGAEGSFGQFQALPLGVSIENDPVSDIMDMQYPVIETEEPRWLKRRSDQEKHLFKEFIQKTVFLFYSTSTEDPFPLELQHLALQNEPLYLGLIATHVYNTNPRNPPPLFHDLCNQSLRLFREQLSRFDGTLDGGLINAGVFLCTLHLFQGIPWTAHLNHMMWVYHLFPHSKNAHRIGDLEYRFSLEAMAIMDIPTFVRGRDTPTLGIWGFLRSAQKASPTGLVGGVESVSGLPRSLLDIFGRMAHEDVEKDLADWEGHEGSIPHVHLWEAFRLSGILLARRQKRTHSGSPSNEILYAHILATNSMLYPYTAARLEVTILQTRPTWVQTLRRCGSICDAYRDTPNALILEEILDKALERGDNDLDLDKETKLRGVELSRSEIILVPTPSQDPNDPLNWSKRRKAWNFTLVLAVTVAFFSAIVMQMVLWQQMIIDMHVTYDQLNYGVAFNSAGLALGSFLFIPLARKYGSRPCYILSTGLMAAVSWWSGRMETVGEMYVTNFLSGLAASINETISEITIADLFFVHQRGTANGFYIMAVMVGQFVCPCIVGVQAAAQDWRWTYYTTGIVLTVLFLLFIFFFEETKFIPVTIGETRNTSSQGPPTLKNPKDDPTQADVQDSDLSSETHPPRLTYKQRMRFITRTDEPLWRNYLVPLKMFLFPHVLFSALQVASCVAFLILLTSSISMIFSAPPYNFNTAGVGLMSLGPFVGNFLGSVYGGVLGDWVVVKLAKRNKGIFEPEMRLYILLLPALLMGGGLVFFGISADKGWHWIYPSIGGAMFGFGMASMIDISCTIVIDIYQTLTAEAFISVTFIRNIPSIGVPFGVVGWISSIGISKLFIISGCVATLVCLLFIPCAIWGRRVRENTWQMYQSVRELKGAARH